MLWNSPSVVTRPGPRPEGQGGEQPDQQLVGVGRQRDAAPRVSQEPGKSLADPLGLAERVLPLVVHVSRRVQPGRHLAVEPAIRPGLVGVAGQQQTLGDPESRIVGREGVGGAVEGRGVHCDGLASTLRERTITARSGSPRDPETAAD